MNIGPHVIGMCSWAIRPGDAETLVSNLQSLGLTDVQLALGPMLSLDPPARRNYFDKLRASGIHVLSGMIGFEGEHYGSIARIRESGGFLPTDLWPSRRVRTIDSARLAVGFGVTQLSTHVGFIPADDEPLYQIMLDRIGSVSREMNQLGVRLLLETGQEKAHTLVRLLADLHSSAVAVNFDPANMLLYGAGDPVAAAEMLGKHIGQVHVKDALASAAPGREWGKEVPFGDGDVPHQAFINALNRAGYRGPLVIERESGNQLAADVQTAIGVLRKLFS